jgi:hypothetical protein
MQQLQGSYGGDRSDTLAQIMGMDYDPQGQMAQMANAMLQTGMASSTALKKEDAATYRQFLNQQFQMNESKRTRKQALEDDRRKRAQYLEDAARQRGEAVEDLQFQRTSRLEDMLFQRQGVVEDRDFARTGTIEDRNFRRQNELDDAKTKETAALNELRSKAMGKRLGMLQNIDFYLDQMNPNDPTQAKEIEGIKRVKSRLLTDVFKDIDNDPVAMAMAVETIFGAGTGEAQFGSSGSLLRSQGSASPEEIQLMKEFEKRKEELRRKLKR